MNSYLYASNLAHIHAQIAWAAAKRGMAAHTLADPWGDTELVACRDKKALKLLLLKRQENWKQKHGLVVVQPAVQLGLWDLSQTSTDVAER